MAPKRFEIRRSSSGGALISSEIPSGDDSVPARIFSSAAFSSSRTGCGTVAAGEITKEITPLARP